MFGILIGLSKSLWKTVLTKVTCKYFLFLCYNPKSEEQQNITEES